MNKILILEDEFDLAQTIAALLNEFNCFISINSEEAIDILKNNDIDLVLADFHLKKSNHDGLEICRIAKEKNPNIPVIILSGCDHDHKMKCYQGGIDDFMGKPFDFEELVFKIKAHIQNAKLREALYNKNEELTKAIIESHKSSIVALSKLTEYRDDHTGKHLERVSEYAFRLAKRLALMDGYKNYIDLNYLENLKYASVLHDIGKVGVPDSVLLKPGRLTAEEFDIIKKHCAIGADTLVDAKNEKDKNTIISMAIKVCRHHHENWDGTGYPTGLKGLDIPLSARIVSVVDFYDAVSNKRVYRDALPKEECIKLLREQRDVKFQPDILDAFLEMLESGELDSIYSGDKNA